jgi:tetratricopeptide (TPR) repeat protein
LQRARTLYRQLALEDPNDLMAQRDMALIAGRIGEALLRGTRRLEEAAAAYRETVEVLSRLSAQEPLAAEPKRGAAYARATLGEIHNALRQPEAALRELEPAIVTLEELRAADPSDQVAPFALASALNFHGDSALQLGKLDLSLRSFAEAERLSRSTTQIPDLQIVHAMALTGLANVHARQATSGTGAQAAAHRADARRWAQRALASLTPLTKELQISEQARELVARAEAALASVQGIE